MWGHIPILNSRLTYTSTRRLHNLPHFSLHGPTMSTRIPALLEPYLTLPPESSLVLVTSVLGARANWLVLRFLCSFLRPAAAADGEEEEDTGVVLVSFLRDGAFWRDGAAKLVSAAAHWEGCKLGGCAWSVGAVLADCGAGP